MSTSDLQETQWKMFNMQELSDFHSHIRLFSEAHKVKIISYRDKKNSVCDWYGSQIILKMKKKKKKLLSLSDEKKSRHHASFKVIQFH